MIQPENHLCSARIRIAFGDENDFQQLFSLWRTLWTRFGNEEVYWVPMVHLLMVWLWSGGLMSAWYLWDGRCLVGEVEYWCSSCNVGVDDVSLVGDSELWRWFGPVPLFPVPPLIPYFPKCPPIISRTPCDPIFPKVLSLWFSAGAAVHFFPWVGYRSPLKKCPWPVRQAVLCSLLDVVGCTTHRTFLYLGIRQRSAPLGTSANSLVAGDVLDCL